MDPASSSISPDKPQYQRKPLPPTPNKKSDAPKEDLLKTATLKTQETQGKVQSKQIPPAAAAPPSTLVQHAKSTAHVTPAPVQSFQTKEAIDKLREQDPSLQTKFEAYSGMKGGQPQYKSFDVLAYQEDDKTFYGIPDSNLKKSSNWKLETAPQVKTAIALRQHEKFRLAPIPRKGDDIYIFSFDVHPGSEENKSETKYCFKFHQNPVNDDFSSTMGTIIINSDGTLSAKMVYVKKGKDVESDEIMELGGKTKFNSPDELLKALKEKFPEG